MAENLKTTKYNDGTYIPYVTDNTGWSSLTTPAYCWYNNDVSTYKTTYSGLYNWYVVDKASNGGKNVCPTGWHVSDIGEWNVLWYPFKVNYNPDPLNNKIGKELMETGTTHWIKPWGTNETGFTALPGGRRSYYGIYSGIGEYTSFWSSNMWPCEFASYCFSLPISESYGITPMSMTASWLEGLSIRCLRD